MKNLFTFILVICFYAQETVQACSAGCFFDGSGNRAMCFDNLDLPTEAGQRAFVIPENESIIATSPMLDGGRILPDSVMTHWTSRNAVIGTAQIGGNFASRAWSKTMFGTLHSGPRVSGAPVPPGTAPRITTMQLLAYVLGVSNTVEEAIVVTQGVNVVNFVGGGLNTGDTIYLVCDLQSCAAFEWDASGVFHPTRIEKSQPSVYTNDYYRNLLAALPTAPAYGPSTEANGALNVVSRFATVARALSSPLEQWNSKPIETALSVLARVRQVNPQGGTQMQTVATRDKLYIWSNIGSIGFPRESSERLRWLPESLLENNRCSGGAVFPKGALAVLYIGDVLSNGGDASSELQSYSPGGEVAINYKVLSRLLKGKQSNQAIARYACALTLAPTGNGCGTSAIPLDFEYVNACANGVLHIAPTPTLTLYALGDYPFHVGARGSYPVQSKVPATDVLYMASPQAIGHLAYGGTVLKPFHPSATVIPECGKNPVYTIQQCQPSPNAYSHYRQFSPENVPPGNPLCTLGVNPTAIGAMGKVCAMNRDNTCPSGLIPVFEAHRAGKLNKAADFYTDFLTTELNVAYQFAIGYSDVKAVGCIPK